MSYLQFHHFHFPQLQRDRTIRVLLPKDYFTAPDRRYPVLYMLDGQNLFQPETAFGRRDWKIPGTLHKQPLRRQAIIVGIDNGGHDRIHEYAPFRRGKNGGQGDLFVRALLETLKPFIDHAYRTLPGRETTGIAGSSLGGLLAFYAGVRYGDVFGKAAVFSPSLWFNPAVVQLAEQNPVWKSKMYVAASKTEMRNMENTLQNVYWSFKKGGYDDAQIRVVARDQGKHNEVFWGREFKKMYEWMYEN